MNKRGVIRILQPFINRAQTGKKVAFVLSRVTKTTMAALKAELIRYNVGNLRVWTKTKRRILWLRVEGR